MNSAMHLAPTSHKLGPQCVCIDADGIRCCRSYSAGKMVCDEHSAEVGNLGPMSAVAAAAAVDIESGKPVSVRKRKYNSSAGSNIGRMESQIMTATADDPVKIGKQQIWVQDICGIMYVLDYENNVYDVRDVKMNVVDPRVVGKWTRDVESGEYSVELIKKCI